MEPMKCFLLDEELDLTSSGVQAEGEATRGGQRDPLTQ